MDVWVLLVSNKWGDDAWVYGVYSNEDAAKADGSHGEVEWEVRGDSLIAFDSSYAYRVERFQVQSAQVALRS